MKEQGNGREKSQEFRIKNLLFCQFLKMAIT